MNSKPKTPNCSHPELASRPEPRTPNPEPQTPNPEPKTQNSTNIVWHEGNITASDRERVLGQRGCVLWFTGLSGSGKSTIARALEEALIHAGHAACVLDGDNVRHGLNSDLDFSPASRKENIRRIGEVAKLFSDAGLITITAFISPYQADRDRARSIITAESAPPLAVHSPQGDGGTSASRFMEVYVNTPIEVCEDRDPKKLYAKARAGTIPNFTGISAPFEAPPHPEIELLTHQKNVTQCVDQILSQLHTAQILNKND